MGGRGTAELREELSRLLQEQIESLTKQTFLGPDDAELSRQEARLKRIREVSADFLAALKRAKEG